MRENIEVGPLNLCSRGRGLVKGSVHEINLISQDTTYYGMDLAAKAGPRQQLIRRVGRRLLPCFAKSKNRGRILAAPALYTPSALER
jgi:hypothetical protein